ncbi:MAG: penicillin-binding protein [Candidatus Jacksonbacteria bacterium]
MPLPQRTWKSRKIKYYGAKPKKTRHSFGRRNLPNIQSSYHSFRPQKNRSSGRNFLIFIFSLGIIGVLTLAGLFFYYSQSLPSLEQIKSGKLVIAESTKIYDRTGKHLLYTVHGEENRTRISLEKIPDYVKWATISTEDQDFYTRGLAIDFKGLARAIISVLKNRSFVESPGGSTITQQLIKNMILTRERTISRKIKEIILAFRIEKTLSRDEILELYLNQIPYGSNAYGIEQAAQTFFNKSAIDLIIGESALLAALPKATTYYSPWGTHTEELYSRQKIILGQMLDQGYITEEQWKAAREEQIKFASSFVSMEAPHFVIYIKEILAHRYGETELEQGGLKVITTLDYDMQKTGEKVVKDGAAKNDALGADNAALVALDPKTGQILTMVGSRDYFDEEHNGNFNVVLAKRQPGSSFKPIIYAALFAKGYTANTVLYDAVTDFAPSKDKEYIPKNFDGKERGPVKIRQALAWSLNIPAVKTLYLADIFKVLDYAAQLGYSTMNDPNQVGLSLALGSNDVKPLEHTAAFAVLANDGVRQPISAILRVEKSDGEVLEEFKELEGVRVFPELAVRQVTDILSDNEARSAIFGANSDLYLGDIPAAAKTGTTNDNRDAWTVGYTPNLAAGVWVGRNDYSPMNKGVGGSMAAAPIWHAFMKQALAGKKIIPFEKPEIPETGKPVLDGQIEGVAKVKIDKISGKLATEYTPLQYVEEVSFADFHSILHYIDKNNPLGPPPANPDSDPQYQNWEEAIARWARESEKAAQFKRPPTEYDDVHLPKNNPTLKVILPQNDQIIADDSFLVQIEISTPRKINKAEYYIDNSFRESAGLSPYSRRLYFGSTADGYHTITVKVFDDVGNQAVQDVKINLNRGIIQNLQETPKQTMPNITILSPESDAVLSRQNFPLKIHLYLDKSELAQRVNLYYNDKQDNPIIIDSIAQNLSSNITIDWIDAPATGTYPLYAILIDKNGESYRGEINVTVK